MLSHVVYCISFDLCLTIYPKTQQLKTRNIYHLNISVVKSPGMPQLGPLALGLSQAVMKAAGRGWGHLKDKPKGYCFQAHSHGCWQILTSYQPKTSVSCHMGLSVGLLATRQLASPRSGRKRGRKDTQERSHILGKVILEMIFHHFCCSLFFRNTSRSADHPQRAESI